MAHVRHGQHLPVLRSKGEEALPGGNAQYGCIIVIDRWRKEDAVASQHNLAHPASLFSASMQAT